MISRYTEKEAYDWLTKSTLQDGSDSSEQVRSSVAQIISDIKCDGDAAVKKYITKFGDPLIDGFKLSEKEIESSIENLSADSKRTINRAANNIRNFAKQVMESVKPTRIETSEFNTGLSFAPVERVGCYVPGGKFPLPSTALMTAITAQVAGVKQICIATPSLCDATIYAGSLAGVDEFYIIGGAQAIAAMAVGVESIRKVDMVVGPGNAYVTEAKRQLSGVVGIDMLAGPSEIAIIADQNQNPKWIAIDLVSQAEHGSDALAYLMTDDSDLADKVEAEVKEILQSSMESLNGTKEEQFSIFVFPNIEACIEFSNKLAPEHLELHIQDPWSWKEKLTNYGALLIGSLSTVPHGDYAAGPNHTLPTNRSAHFSGALTPLSFLRPQTWLEVKPGASNLAQTTVNLANIEGLEPHALAAKIRTK